MISAVLCSVRAEKLSRAGFKVLPSPSHGVLLTSGGLCPGTQACLRGSACKIAALSN